MSHERSSVLADTHVLVWYTTAPGMLSTTALRIVEDAVAAAQPIVIAAVSLIELVYIAETLRELLASIQASDSPIAIAPMTVDVAHQMVSVSRTQVRDPFAAGVVFFTGERPLPFGDRLIALPISLLWGGAVPPPTPSRTVAGHASWLAGF